MLLAQTLVSGILLGELYAAMAMGFSIMWGVMNVINLAHGSMILTGAYITFWFHSRFGIDPILTIPVSAGVLFVFGFLLQKYVLNRVVMRNIFLTLILTFGLDMVLINLNIVLFTADIRSISTWYSGQSLDVYGIKIAYTRLIVFILAILLSFILYFFLRFSRIGMAIRATAQNPAAARVLGIETGYIYAVTFGLGAAMAGAAGSLLAVVYAFSPVIGAPFTLKSFVIVILGGLGNIFGVITSAVFLGVMENLVSGFGHPGYRDAISFGLLVIVLLLRPQGFFGRKSYSETRV